MYCLHCGDCCKRMSPITGKGEPCPNIIENGDFVFCSKYEDRPEECKNHGFPSRFCPIGIDMLELKNTEDIRQRIDEGFQKIKEF